MEEVDNIIIHSLRQVGCDIDESITNLKGFDTELTVDAVVRCLEIITPDFGISKILPGNMAARFRVGASLAQKCAELGFRGDIGYQTFLYSSETDLRRVFMFLIEKLPKESDKEINEPISKLDELEKTVSIELSQQLKSPWLPHYCHKSLNGGYTQVPYRTTNLQVPALNQQELQEYNVRYQIPITDQITNENNFLLPSLISRNAKLLYSRPINIFERIEWLNKYKLNENTGEIVSSNSNNVINHNDKLINKFPLNKNLQDDKLRLELINDNNFSSKTIDNKTNNGNVNIVGDTNDNDEEINNLNVETIKNDCENIKIEIEKCQNDINKLTVQLSQLIIKKDEDEKELISIEEKRRIKRKIYDLLQDGENNIKKLENAIETEKNKLINLANQWERHRAPLIKKYRDEREKYSVKANTSQQKLDELRKMRDKERELIEEYKIKDQQYGQLIIEVEKLPKDSNRSAYTQRIIEIINNVKKQKDEIDKVLGDTREIQKEINMLTGKLERSFTVVDELIFRDAKNNEASRKAYKLLATLHSDCSELVKLVEETGSILREIRDLEDQIDSESSKNIKANLERITADLEQMRQETASLTAQLANKNS